MQRLAVETTVYASPEAVYERLAAVEEYPRYAEYLAAVERCGDDAGNGRTAATDGELADGGTADGTPDGTADGTPGGTAEGAPDGTAEDAPDAGADSAGTAYALRFAWWRLSYTVHSRVTATAPPERIDWRLTRDIDARGAWTVQSLPVPAGAPPGTEAATRIRFAVRYDPDSFEPAGVELPPLVSTDWLAERVTPLVVEEARRVVGRLVRELEGTDRSPSLSVERGRDVTR